MDYYIGLMSGTSMDGIDAALIAFDNHHTKLIETHALKIPPSIKSRLLQLIQNQNIDLILLGETDVALGELFAEAALQLLKKADFSAEKITAIGSHGQTIYHKPHGRYPFTLQIGDPHVIAARTAITTVADFRRRDVALGGQGAPLTPAFHAYLFPRYEQDQYVLNLGGIANITYIPADSTKPIIGFDTGPANTLIDQWCEKHTGHPYDKNGAWAQSGKIIPELLETLLADDYFQKPFPKSTGREYFKLDWLKKHLTHTIAAANDIQATLTALTAKTVANAILEHTHTKLWLCGGGSNNVFLCDLLATYLPHCSIESTEKKGIPPQWIECAAFAWLAKQTIEKKPGNMPSVTGAATATRLGSVFPRNNTARP